MTMTSVHVIQLITGLAWIPVAILIFRVGERATFFMIAVTAFAPTAISVVSGVKRVDETYVRAARMLGASGGTLLLRVLVPGAPPQILSGLRVGPGHGWRVLVAAEMIVGTGTGLGYSIIPARWTLDYPAASQKNRLTYTRNHISAPRRKRSRPSEALLSYVRGAATGRW